LGVGIANYTTGIHPFALKNSPQPQPEGIIRNTPDEGGGNSLTRQPDCCVRWCTTWRFGEVLCLI
jgi:hypothetical protein